MGNNQLKTTDKETQNNTLTFKLTWDSSLEILKTVGFCFVFVFKYTYYIAVICSFLDFYCCKHQNHLNFTS